MGADKGFDFAARDSTGRRTVLVQAKRRLGTNAAWATQLRRNTLAHRSIQSADLFVLVVPDRLYIWNASAPLDAAPAHELDARPLLEPYFERVGVPPEQIESMAFELLISWWLDDLTRSATAGTAKELSRSGLIDALAGAEIAHEAAA